MRRRYRKRFGPRGVQPRGGGEPPDGALAHGFDPHAPIQLLAAAAPSLQRAAGNMAVEGLLIDRLSPNVQRQGEGEQFTSRPEAPSAVPLPAQCLRLSLTAFQVFPQPPEIPFIGVPGDVAPDPSSFSEEAWPIGTMLPAVNLRPRQPTPGESAPGGAGPAPTASPGGAGPAPAASPTAAGGATLDVPAGSRLVRRGSRGSDVAELQSRLTDQGFELAADGIFGKRTDAAVRQFQEQNALDVDGIVGPLTWKALGVEVPEPEVAPALPLRWNCPLRTKCNSCASSINVDSDRALPIHNRLFDNLLACGIPLGVL